MNEKRKAELTPTPICSDRREAGVFSWGEHSFAETPM